MNIWKGRYLDINLTIWRIVILYLMAEGLANNSGSCTLGVCRKCTLEAPEA